MYMCVYIYMCVCICVCVYMCVCVCVYKTRMSTAILIYNSEKLDIV